MQKWLKSMMVFTLCLMVLLAGCDSKSATPSSQPATDGASPNATTQQVPVSFTILSNDGGQAYAKKAKPDDDFYKQMSKLFSDSIGQPTTINFEMVPAASYSAQLTTRFASNDFPDVLATTGIEDKGTPTAVKNGIFLPLNDLIDKYGPNLKKKIPQYVWDSPKVSSDGKIYGIPKMLTPLNPAGFYVRQDWLDKLNMKTPETLDDYLKFFEAVKNTDLNGNGKHDEFGYDVRGGFGFSNAFFGAFGVSGGAPMEWQLVDGKFIPDIINPKMKDAVKFYKMLYDKGYMNKDFLTTVDTGWGNYIYNGNAATWSHDLRNLGNQWSADKFKDKNVKLGFLPGFKGDDGVFKYQPKGLGVAKVFIATKNMKNPERFVQYMNWVYSDDAAKNQFFDFGIEGRNYTMDNGKIKWDPKTPANVEEAAFYETMIYPGGDARMDKPVVEKGGQIDPQLLQKGLDYADKMLWDDPSINMPVPEAIGAKPDLNVGAGSLFLTMLTQSISGKKDADTAFDDFVKEWKSRGGDKAIEEATAWYNQNHKK